MRCLFTLSRVCLRARTRLTTWCLWYRFVGSENPASIEMPGLCTYYPFPCTRDRGKTNPA